MMKCFNHHDDEAIGICKTCNKGVCSSCVIEADRGIVCSEACREELNDINQVTDKAKILYSVNQPKKVIPTGILIFWFFGLTFLGAGIYQSVKFDGIAFFPLIMGVGFLAIGAIAWYRNRTLNINC